METSAPHGASGRWRGRLPDVMELLNRGVPLSLLADLTDPDGPRSQEILAVEGGPETAWWVR